MSEPLEPALMRSLVRSRAWRALAPWLETEYRQASHPLDLTRDDHRLRQGMKHGLALALEQPYSASGDTSPLAPPPAAGRRRPVRREEAAVEEDDAWLKTPPSRPSYLA